PTAAPKPGRRSTDDPHPEEYDSHDHDDGNPTEYAHDRSRSGSRMRRASTRLKERTSTVPPPHRRTVGKWYASNSTAHRAVPSGGAPWPIARAVRPGPA